MVTSLQRKRYPRQSTRLGIAAWMRKENGQVNWVVGLFLVLFVAVLLLASIQAERFQAVSLYTEDALAASNLASALVDLEEYGISGRILIAEPEAAYRKYREALRENLNLNEEWIGTEGSVITGPVTVESYIVYNMDDEGVLAYRFGPEGKAQEEMHGTVMAPNGIRIENTSVYSEISFVVDVIPGLAVQAHKGKLVDVAADRMIAGQ